MTTLIALLSFGFTNPQEPNIDSYVQTSLQDLQIVAKIVKGDQNELKKINRDFGASYRFEQTTLSFKPPFMMRAESKVEDSSVTYILNGTDLVMKLGGFKSPQNLANKPGRRQTTVEVGLLSNGLIHALYEGKYVGDDKSTNSVIFDLTYTQGDIDKSHSRIWIDSTKKYIIRRDWFNQEGKQLATFDFSVPQNIGGVWIPTHMEVRNGEGNLAGVTDYKDIKVNSGLDDSLFKVK